MKVVKFLSVVILGCIFMFSCESSTYEDISVKVDNPTYLARIQPIIQNNCLSCHSAVGGEFPALETYSQVRNSAELGNMICRIDDQSCGSVMPQSGRMPQANIDAIKKWVSNGFPN